MAGGGEKNKSDFLEKNLKTQIPLEIESTLIIKYNFSFNIMMKW